MDAALDITPRNPESVMARSLAKAGLAGVVGIVALLCLAVVPVVKISSTKRIGRLVLLRRKPLPILNAPAIAS